MEYTDQELDALRRKALTALSHIVNKRTWIEWLTIGEYLQTGRQWAMQISRSNEPKGIRYNQAINVWFKRNHQFEKLEKDERNDLMRCMENLPAIETFLAGQEGKKGRQLIHPTSVWRAYKRNEAKLASEAARERAEQLAADSLKADDGTPLNAPVFPDVPPLPLLEKINELEIMRHALALRKGLGDEWLRALHRAIGRILNIPEGEDE